MANIKRNIIFSLENRKKDGVPVVENVPIRMRVIFLNNRVDFSTGYRIDVQIPVILTTQFQFKVTT